MTPVRERPDDDIEPNGPPQTAAGVVDRDPAGVRVLLRLQPGARQGPVVGPGGAAQRPQADRVGALARHLPRALVPADRAHQRHVVLALNTFYGVAHFIVTPAVAVFLFRKRQRRVPAVAQRARLDDRARAGRLLRVPADAAAARARPRVHRHDGHPRQHVAVHADPDLERRQPVRRDAQPARRLVAVGVLRPARQRQEPRGCELPPRCTR